MQYKAAIFDIDGTLVQIGESAPAPATVQALRSLQQRGVKLVIATGRCMAAAKGILCPITPDYILCNNGAEVRDAAGRLLVENRFNEQEMYALVDFAEDDEIPLAFSFEDGYYVYVSYTDYKSIYKAKASVEYMVDEADQQRHLQSMPFAAGAFATQQQAAAFTQRYPHLGLRWVPYAVGAYDIFRGTVNKAQGLALLAEKAGFSLAEAAAFGDGANDAEMLAECALGVAMRHGNPALHQSANHVADSIIDAISHVFGKDA